MICFIIENNVMVDLLKENTSGTQHPLGHLPLS